MRRHQRPHARSPRAIDKPYRFVELPLCASLDGVLGHLHGLGSKWQGSQWKWHRGTQFCVLRGGPPGDGPASELVTGRGIDTPVLKARPGLRRWLDTVFPVPPVVAWLGSSPRGAAIRAHVDNTHHWDEHHRVHVPVLTSPEALLCVEGRFVHLRRGSAWLLNNSLVHGAYNGGSARLHLVADLPATSAVQAWIDQGTHHRGRPHPELQRLLEVDPLGDLTPAERSCRPLMERMQRQ